MLLDKVAMNEITCDLVTSSESLQDSSNCQSVNTASATVVPAGRANKICVVLSLIVGVKLITFEYFAGGSVLDEGIITPTQRDIYYWFII